MADRIFQKKKRNDVKRKRKPVMLITAEGRNKTEKQYFNSFQDQHGKYSIRFATGLETDPVGMLKAMEKAWKKNELSEKDGDKAYIVLDMDCKPEKIQLVKELAKYIPGYEESMDISAILRPMLNDAEKHLEQLKGYYETLGVAWGDADCNPMTDIVEVLEELEVL